MSTGQPIRLRAAMKPFSTVPRPLATVDLATGTAAVAIKQRTDVCAVPAGGVVGEAVVAFVLANAVLEKFGGDSLARDAPEPGGVRGDARVIVYLVGMPGSGKSVVGEELAGRLGVPVRRSGRRDRAGDGLERRRTSSPRRARRRSAR